MSNFAVDLISDLHVESWGSFDWTGQPTSQFCVVAGDIAKDRSILKSTLSHLGQCYQQVFYIDGNDEHRYYLDNLDASYEHLFDMIHDIDNVTYLRDNIVILDNTAIVAVNGWWSFDFDSNISLDQSIKWFMDYTNTSEHTISKIIDQAHEDATYLHHSVSRLQRFPEVESIMIVSHTVPSPWLVNHDIELTGHPRFNSVGNQHLARAFSADSEGKIKQWCMGHYHNCIERELAGTKYVSNVRGRANTSWCQTAFYPKRIVID